MLFQNRLIQLRENQSLSQKLVSEKIDISLRSFQRYESGEREPSMSTLIALADLFDVSIDYLVGRSDDPKRY